MSKLAFVLVIVSLALAACSGPVSQAAGDSIQPTEATPVSIAEPTATSIPPTQPAPTLAATLPPPTATAPAAEGTCKPAEILTPENGQVVHEGITFSLDPALATSVEAQHCQSVPFRMEDLPGTAHPAGVTFTFPSGRQRVDFQPQITVYEIDGHMQDYLFPLNSLPDLQALLEERPEPSPWFDHAPLHVWPQYLDFGGGAGVRGIIEYAQDIFFFHNNGLLYNFDGLTSDGRYYMNVRIPVAVPFLMDLAGPDLLSNTNPDAIPISGWPSDYEQQRAVIDAYNQEALRRFEQATGADFTPDVAVLDALVRSLQVVAP